MPNGASTTGADALPGGSLTGFTAFPATWPDRSCSAELGSHLVRLPGISHIKVGEDEGHDPKRSRPRTRGRRMAPNRAESPTGLSGSALTAWSRAGLPSCEKAMRPRLPRSPKNSSARCATRRSRRCRRRRMSSTTSCRRNSSARCLDRGWRYRLRGDQRYAEARFKADPAQRRQVMDRGLWRYTRHPDYFGEACVWWGLGLVAVSAAGSAGTWSLLSPLLMTVLLLRVSGVTLLEKDMGERRPAYRDYIARTPAFFPGLPRAPR